MNDDVKQFIDNCEVCNYNRTEEPLKAPTVIISSGPLHRIQADLWQIPKKIFEAIGKTHSHIITCTDHFSKYKWCHLIKDKRPQTVKQIFELVFSTFKPPSILHAGNGGEFKNAIIQEFLAIHQVEPVYGAPRHPQSQRAVERSNYWLGLHVNRAYEAWISQRTDETQLWDISLELMKFVSAENNRVHIVTKEIPNHLIISQDKKLIETVKQRIQNRYCPQAQKHISNAEESLKKNSKVFIVKKIIPNKSHTRLNTSTSNYFRSQPLKKLPAIVVDDFKAKKKFVTIKFVTEVGEQFKQNHNYRIQVNKLSLADERSWINIVNHVKKKIKIDLGLRKKNDI